jgi:cellulose synthase/poly-beta-1,6-N-acetylglucosamine synthase-like glycosyltransferase
MNRKVSSKVSLLIPCYNEESLVHEKVENIKSLDYPKELLDIYFLDGSSTDKTVELILEKTRDMDNVKVIKTGCRGKIAQINYILPKLDSDIIVNTDMDTLLNEDVLLKLVRTLENDKEVVVAGAHVIPRTNFNLELQYWHDQNLMRFLESKVHSSSIVIAPCYAFRKDLLDEFPDDCIADDIYISFLANAKRKKSKYVEDAVAFETRTPSTIEELLRHKFRKGNAYIVELLRFLYKLPVIQPMWKIIYITKFIQVILIPWIIPFFLLSSVSQIIGSDGNWRLPFIAFLFLALSLVITRSLFSRGIKEIENKTEKRSLISLFVITNIILLLNGLTFPFYTQTSNYNKINRKDRK